MSEDVEATLNEMLLMSENILRTIEEVRKADNRKRELEAALIEATLNKKSDKEIVEELENIEASLSEVEEKLKTQLKELSKKMEVIKDIYNNRIRESVGEIREITRAGKNA